MRPLSKLFIGGAGLLLGGALWWRFAARRRALPCPPWLGWLLDPPIHQFDAASSIIVDRLDLAPGMQVLDVGCGVGRLTVPAAQRVGPTGTVVAVDLQAEMLQRARAKAEAAGLSNI